MISNHSPLRWPNWREVYEVWSRVRPPELEVVLFVIGTYREDGLWFDRRERQQALFRFAIADTAHHLLETLSAVTAERLAAFKIYARCREKRADKFTAIVINPVFWHVAWPVIFPGDHKIQNLFMFSSIYAFENRR